MIENRPAALLADATYGTLPKLPFALDWTSIPELLRVATLDLSGIQPLTKAMFKAAGGTLHDKPSQGEVELFRKRGTQFQLVSVVLSVVPAGEVDGVLQVRPRAESERAKKRPQGTHSDALFVPECQSFLDNLVAARLGSRIGRTHAANLSIWASPARSRRHLLG
jgi:hypothetical protein